MRVLVVEDEPKLADLLRKGLRQDGLEVDLAGRGEDALSMAAASHYDVILLDLMLPGIDGLETCRRLRADGVKTPIALLTARDAADYRAAGLEVGADDYITKPFDFDELGARLHALGRNAPPEST
jgi:two-component system OmpR family response regulator